MCYVVGKCETEYILSGFLHSQHAHAHVVNACIYVCSWMCFCICVSSAAATVSVLLEQGEPGAETAETNEVLCNPETVPWIIQELIQ